MFPWETLKITGQFGIGKKNWHTIPSFKSSLKTVPQSSTPKDQISAAATPSK